MGNPNSWMVYKGTSHLEIDDLGVPLFQETSISTINPSSPSLKCYKPIQQSKSTPPGRKKTNIVNEQITIGKKTDM